jgi:dipeptidyl-peptidase-3
MLCSGMVANDCSGFTAMVDKKLSAKYETLVNEASELIKVLPWGKDFEVRLT